tara:strand:+ start:89 stop:295 length:207 start_codon:yes stop_codon:yes gene_type:complete
MTGTYHKALSVSEILEGVSLSRHKDESEGSLEITFPGGVRSFSRSELAQILIQLAELDREIDERENQS